MHYRSLPRVVSFLVLIILAANSCPVDFCTHRLTMENAPLRKTITIIKISYLIYELLGPLLDESYDLRKRGLKKKKRKCN